MSFGGKTAGIGVAYGLGGVAHVAGANLIRIWGFLGRYQRRLRPLGRRLRPGSVGHAQGGAGYAPAQIRMLF
jgi:hypothetical protein